MKNPWRRVSSILREVLDGPLRRWASQRIADMVVGLKRTYVELEEGWCGVALTPRWLPLRIKARLQPGEETPRRLVRLIESEESPLATVLATAAVNAATSAWIASTPFPKGIRFVRDTSSIIDSINVEGNDKILLLGYMPAIAERLRAYTKRIVIADFDEQLLRKAREKGFMTIHGSSQHVLEEARHATILIVSGSAIADPPRLIRELDAAANARAKIIMGATSSFHPLVALRLGFTHMAGVWIDPRLCIEVKESAMMGKGLREVRGKIVYWIWSG